jgi:hypothetical protein
MLCEISHFNCGSLPTAGSWRMGLIASNRPPRIYELLLEDLGEMLKPLVASADAATTNGAAQNYTVRLENLTEMRAQITDQTVSGGQIDDDRHRHIY